MPIPIIKSNVCDFLVMTLIQGFNLRGLVEVSSDVALIVAYYKFLAVFADNELSQV